MYTLSRVNVHEGSMQVGKRLQWSFFCSNSCFVDAFQHAGNVFLCIPTWYRAYCSRISAHIRDVCAQRSIAILAQSNTKRIPELPMGCGAHGRCRPRSARLAHERWENWSENSHSAAGMHATLFFLFVCSYDTFRYIFRINFTHDVLKKKNNFAIVLLLEHMACLLTNVEKARVRIRTLWLVCMPHCLFVCVLVWHILLIFSRINFA